MKHGPNALIDENLPVVVLATRDPDSDESRTRYEKTLSNIQEVKARSGIVIAVRANRRRGGWEDCRLPDYDPPQLNCCCLSRIVPLQLTGLSHCGAPGLRCGSTAQPRKSVTVE